MAFETLVLDSVVSSNGLKNATVGNLNADDGSWATATSGGAAPSILVTFPSPSADLIVGTDLQTFSAKVRKNSTGSPTVRLELWELSTKLLVGPDVTITSTIGQTVNLTWNAALLSDLSGADVELKLVCTPDVKTSVDVGYIAWADDHEGGASTGAVTAVLGDAALSSVGGVALGATLAVTLASIGLNGAGHKPTDRTATSLNGTLGSLTGTITGQLTHAGQVDATLGGLGIAATGTIIQPPFDAVLTAGISAITWQYGKPDSVVRGAYTGARSSILNPWAARWKAHVELPAVQGEDKARTIRSFIAQRTGRTVSFRLPAVAVAQNANAGVALSSDAARGATSIQISGATTALKDGQLLTVNGQLLCCVADQSGSTVNFLPPLRQAAAAGTIVITSKPYARMFLANSAASWAVGQNRMFKFTLDVEEAVLVHDDPPPETLNDTGHLMKTLASLGLAAAGALKIAGTLAKALGGVGLSANGAGRISGSLSVTLAGLGLTAVGTRPAAPNPTFSNVRLLCGFNGTDGSTSFTDESASANTLTAGGNAQIDTAQQKFGTGSLLLDATSGTYVSIPDSGNWDLGSTDDFQVEAWIMFGSGASFTNSYEIFNQWTATGSQRAWRFGVDAGSLIFQYSLSGSSTTTAASAAMSPSTLTWYHVAYSRVGGVSRLFSNGALLTTTGASNYDPFSSSAVARIGGRESSGTVVQLFDGWIDELRYTKVVGGSSGGQLYTAAFTPPTAAFPRS